MWREDTFGLEVAARELGFAAELGFSSVRVFLHDLLFALDCAHLTYRDVATPDKGGRALELLTKGAVRSSNARRGVAPL